MRALKIIGPKCTFTANTPCPILGGHDSSLLKANDRSVFKFEGSLSHNGKTYDGVFTLPRRGVDESISFEGKDNSLEAHASVLRCLQDKTRKLTCDGINSVRLDTVTEDQYGDLDKQFAYWFAGTGIPSGDGNQIQWLTSLKQSCEGLPLTTAAIDRKLNPSSRRADPPAATKR